VTLKVSPSGKFLYVGNANTATISGFSIGSGGALNVIAGSPFTVVTAPSSLAPTPSGQFLYATHPAGYLSIFTVASNSGALTPIPGSPFSNTSTTITNLLGTNPFAVTVDRSGKYLYVVNQGSNNVSAYTLDAATGAPTLITGSPYATGNAPSFIALDTTGKFVYVGNQTSHSITGFLITSSSGTLTNTTTFAINTAPGSMAILK
jgi:6-phosphogluconolactonase (cycloisomerase 2 family)